MSKRKITDFYNVKFEPFDNYGSVVPGMSWHKISYNKKNGGQGTYVLKMDPGTKSLPHQHTGYEEFLVLDGKLIDHDKYEWVDIQELKNYDAHWVYNSLN